MPTASAFVASDAAAVDKAPPRTPDLIASGAPVTHPALRAAWITGRPFHADRGQCRYHPSVTQRFAQLPAIGVERCPRSAWNAARHRLEWVPAISGIRIEVDGERYHRSWTGELCLRDQLRNQRLIELGWEVKRFWVYEVRDNLHECVEAVARWMRDARGVV